MPGWTALISALTKTRAGQAVWWLAKEVGVDKIVGIASKAIERSVSRIGDRRMAVRKARHTKDGSWAPVVVEGRTRWVVYSGSTPIDIFPPIKGDVAKAMETFDTDRLRRPDDVASANARAWARDRLGRLGRRGRDGDATPSQAPEAEVIRDALATSGEEGGQALFHDVVDELPKLLETLTSAPAKPVTALNGVPDKPGIYLFRDGVNPISVGQCSNLRTRLRQLASETDAEFADVTEMEVQFIELEDSVTRTLFEVYAARALGTDELDSGETH